MAFYITLTLLIVLVALNVCGIEQRFKEIMGDGPFTD
jgi:hypothetical protein